METIDFPTWQANEPGFREFWEDYVAFFESKHPDIKVRLHFYPIAEFEYRVLRPLRLGEGPDLIHFPAYYFWELSKDKLLATVPNDVFNLLKLASWHPWQAKLTVCEIPKALLMQVFGYAFLFNFKMFSQAGVQVPTTAQELHEAAIKLSETLGPKVSGLGLTTAKHPVLYREVTQWLIDAGVHWVRDGQLLADREIVYNALTKWHNVVKAANVPLEVPVEEKQQMFAEGKTACIFDGPWVMARLAQSSFYKDIRVAHVPFSKPAGGISHALGVNNISPVREEVWQFLSGLIEQPWIGNYFKRSNSIAPSPDIITNSDSFDHKTWSIFHGAAYQAVDVIPPGYEHRNVAIRDVIVEELYQSLYESNFGECFSRLVNRLKVLDI